MTDNEVVDLCILLGLLDKVYLSVGKRDVRLWKPDAKGNFIMKSFYNVLIDSSNGGGVGLWRRFWDPYIPPRVMVFCWLVRKEKILTRDKLRRRNHFIVNGCPMRSRDEETAHHLFLHCNLARNVWMILFARFGISWVMPWSVEDLFQLWYFKCRFACDRILWTFLLYAFLWKVWLERNNRIFKNNGRIVEDIVEIIVRTVSEIKFYYYKQKKLRFYVD